MLNPIQKKFIKKANITIVGFVVSLGLIGCQTERVDQSLGQTEPLLEVDASRDINRWPQSSSPELNDTSDVEWVKNLLSQMTLEEKVGQLMQAEIQTVTPDDIKKYHLGSVLNGGGSVPQRNENATAKDWAALADSFYDASMDTSDGGVGIPIIWGTDAVHGHNNLRGATIFPHNIGLGAANNAELIKKIGQVTAAEVRATGIDWVFAPTLAVAQNDLWGRTYESYSENPELVKEYAQAMVEGLQGEVSTPNFLSDQHVLACAKHFLGDGGTFGGDDQGDTRVTEQTLIDIHNAGYPAAINAGVQTIMASFSSWNGEKLHGSEYLLTKVLREKLGFDGLVVGDWNGHGQLPDCTNDSCAKAINAGVDLIMVPYDWRTMYSNTLEHVKQGLISAERLDEAVSRILLVKKRGGLFKGSPSSRISKAIAQSVGSQAHRDIAQQAVRQSLVLLKNNNQTLPLNPNQRILVAGDGANNIPMQAGGWSVTWQGAGTSNASFPGATSIYQGLKQAVSSAGGEIELAEDGNYKAKPDAAVVVYGEHPYAEGHGDLNSLEFQPGNKKTLKLLKRLNKQGIPVVSVFLSGRPMWVNPEINASDAFIAAWLPGSEGDGIADVILSKADGKVNYDFTGKLSFSWPAEPLQADVNGPSYGTQKPLFELNYGLSYASPASLNKLNENVKGVASDTLGDIEFYKGRTIQPWTIFIRNHERDQQLSGAYASLPQGDVTIQTTDKDLQEDALRYTWKDAWSTGLLFKNGAPMDLTPYMKEGILSFDLKANQLSNAVLHVEMFNGEDFMRTIPITDLVQSSIGKGWQNVKIDLRCFYQDNDDFSAIAQPFNLGGAGSGEVEIANVTFHLKGEGNFDCPDYKKLSTTPEPHDVYWAAPWWMPRHQAIVEQVKTAEPKLIMIGDSITEGWAKEGKEVWQKYYEPLGAINMGFGGDRTEHVLWRMQNGEIDGINPNVAVLMIGTNNTGHRKEKPELIVNGIEAILEELKARLPETKILLLAIFPRDEKPDSQMRQINNEVNKKIKTLADEDSVFFLDINQVFLTDEGILEKSVMPDLLHLNEPSYELWAEAMAPMLNKLMAE